MIEKLTNYFVSSPKKIFLVDSLGALLTAFLTGVILVQLESIIGMPSGILYILATIAFGFAVYSFLCFLFLPKKWSLFLKTIAIANALYCFVALFLAIYLHPQVSNLGLLYFLLECFVVGIIVNLEWRIATKR